MDPNEELKPARYEASDEARFAAPVAPWRGALLVVGAVVFLIAFYQYRREVRVDDLRQSLQADYAERIFPSVAPVTRFRRQISEWVSEAAGVSSPEPFHAPGFEIAQLHSLPLVYLRISAENARAEATLVTAASTMPPDAVTRCLGLAPMSLRSIYGGGNYLEAAWIDRILDIEEVLQLRVIEDELERHATRDLPALLETIDARYFLLLLTRGPTRISHPVDVYIWKLTGDAPALKLRARVQAMGTLISARNAVGGARPSRLPRDRPGTSGAADCSIAAQIRAAAGEGAPIEVSSTQPAVVPVEATAELLGQAAPDAGLPPTAANP